MWSYHRKKMLSLEFTCIFNQRDILDFDLTLQYMFSLDFMKKCINVSQQWAQCSIWNFSVFPLSNSTSKPL